MVLIYTTCRDVAQAKELGKKILNARVAACVNIWPMESIYPENGAMKEDTEAVLMIKTSESKMAEIEAFLEKYHTYSVPFVGAIDIRRINLKYREWMTAMVRA